MTNHWDNFREIYSKVETIETRDLAKQYGIGPEMLKKIMKNQAFQSPIGQKYELAFRLILDKNNPYRPNIKTTIDGIERKK